MQSDESRCNNGDTFNTYSQHIRPMETLTMGINKPFLDFMFGAMLKNQPKLPTRRSGGIDQSEYLLQYDLKDIWASFYVISGKKKFCRAEYS